ncbi:putative immunity protein [Guggenheimella bovis]
MKLRKMLSNYNHPVIQDIMKQMETQSKETLAHWAVDYSERVLLPVLKKHVPEETCAEVAIEGARAWLKKEKKLPEVKPLFLACHEAARNTDDPIAEAIFRAIGQSASTVHSARHAIGLVFYGALALSYEKFGVEEKWEKLEEEAFHEAELMLQALKDGSVENEPKPAKIVWYC